MSVYVFTGKVTDKRGDVAIVTVSVFGDSEEEAASNAIERVNVKEGEAWHPRVVKMPE